MSTHYPKKNTNRKSFGAGETLSKYIAEGPRPKQSKHSQCVISPTLIGSLKHCLRNDDVCTAAVAYYLKSQGDIPEAEIRGVVEYMRDIDLTNYQVATKIRKKVRQFQEERYIKVRFSLTEFIMNTIDPTYGFKRRSTTESDKSDGLPKVVEEDKKKQKAKKTSSIHLSKRKSQGSDLSRPPRQKRVTDSGEFRTPDGTVVSRRQFSMGRLQQSKEHKTEIDTSDDDGPTTLVEMNALKMKVRKQHIEDVNMEPRLSTSSVSHAMSLKADSEDVAEAVALMHTWSNSEVDSILEREGKWLEMSSDKGGKIIKVKRSESGSKRGTKKSKEQDRKGTWTYGSASVSSRGTTRDTMESLGSQYTTDTNDMDGRASEMDKSTKSSKSHKSPKHHHVKSRSGSAESLPTHDSDSSKVKSVQGSEKPSPSSSQTNMFQSKEGEDQDFLSQELQRPDPLDDDFTNSVDTSMCETTSILPSMDMGPFTKIDLTDPCADRPKTPVAPDQQAEALKYYQTKNIAGIFQILLSNLVLNRPTRPLDHLIELAGKMNHVYKIGHNIDAMLEQALNSANVDSGSKSTSTIGSRSKKSSGSNKSISFCLDTSDEGMPPVEV